MESRGLSDGWGGRRLEIPADAANYDMPCASIASNIGIAATARGLPFIVLSEHRPAPHHLDDAKPAERFKPKAAQSGFGFQTGRHIAPALQALLREGFARLGARMRTARVPV
jgi:hypothetical protein